MQDWSSDDYTRSYGDSLFVPPQDSDAGIYLDEGYDDLGRRRPDAAGYAPPRHSTHWGRAQAQHWPGALAQPGCAPGGRARYSNSVSAYGAPWDPAAAGVYQPNGNSRKEGFAGPGFHLSDREALGPIYNVNWDERPAGYNPAAGPDWARLTPNRMAPAPYSCGPTLGAAPAYPGVPTRVSLGGGKSMSARDWAQNTPWAYSGPSWPGAPAGYQLGGAPAGYQLGGAGASAGYQSGGPGASAGYQLGGAPAGYQLGGAGAKEGFSSKGGPPTGQDAPVAFSSVISTDHIQLIFLFLIVVMLSMIMRSLNQRLYERPVVTGMRPETELGPVD